jgi:hypothetical protein
MTRIDLGLAAQAAVFLAVGYALLYALGLARSGLRDARLAGLAYLAGWSLLGSALSLLLVAGLGPGLWCVLGTAAVLVAACVLAGRRVAALEQGTTARERRPPAAVAAAAGAAMLALALLAALLVSLRGTEYAGYWDAVQFWIPKAVTIFYSGLDPGVWATIRHPEYPPLQPVLDAATFHFAGGVHPALLPFQRTLLGIAFVLAVLALLDRFAPRWVTLPTLALLVATPWFWWRLQSALADQPLAYLVTVGAVACVLWLSERRGAWLALATVLLTAAALTKLEGGFVAILLAAVVVVTGLALRGRAALPALALLLAPLATLPWRLWLGSHGMPTSATDYRVADVLDPGYLADRTHRLSVALHGLLDAPFRQTQTVVLVCASVALLLLAALRRPVLVAAVGAWLALSIAGLAVVYWIGRLGISWYMSTSASRVGAIVIVAAAALAPLLLGLALRAGAGPEPGRDPPA